MSYLWAYLSVTALMLTGILLIFIILLQRGRGGGLAGAFGGAGGQSALGTKAGDVFTKITVGLAVFWVFLACLSIYATRASSSLSFDDANGTDANSVITDGDGQGAGNGEGAGGAGAGGTGAGGTGAGDGGAGGTEAGGTEVGDGGAGDTGAEPVDGNSADSNS